MSLKKEKQKAGTPVHVHGFVFHFLFKRLILPDSKTTLTLSPHHSRQLCCLDNDQTKSFPNKILALKSCSGPRSSSVRGHPGSHIPSLTFVLCTGPDAQRQGHWNKPKNQQDSP